MTSTLGTGITLLSLLSVISAPGSGQATLSRRSAEALIRRTLGLPAAETKQLLVEYTTFGSASSSTIDLQKAGLLTFERRWIGMVYQVESQATAEGNKYVRSNKYSVGDSYTSGIRVKVATLDFGRITGIAETGVRGIVEADYTLVRTAITPFGTVAFGLQAGNITSTATFRRYDDGWRIVSIGFNESTLVQGREELAWRSRQEVMAAKERQQAEAVEAAIRATPPPALMFADIAGKWHSTIMAVAREMAVVSDDIVMEYDLIASDPQRWQVIFPGNHAIAPTAVFSGDSLVIDMGPYDNNRRGGAMVRTHIVVRLIGGDLIGLSTDRYSTPTDSITVFRLRMTRAQ